MATQLIMTVGTNPLPVWVAWHQLKDRLNPVKLTFIHSQQTKTEKDLLVKKIRSESPGTTLQAIPIKPGEPDAIRNAIKENFIDDRPNERPDVHIHYTGGTKSMGVETVSIIERELANDANATVNASYLNPRGSSGPEIVSRTHLGVSDTRDGINIDIESIAELNGIQFTTDPTGLTSDQLNRGKQWLNNSWPDPSAHRVSGESHGAVLEYGTYAAFQQALKNQGQNHWQLYCSVKGKRIKRPGQRGRPRPFELDVVAVLGYQIVVVSCSITNPDTTEGQRTIKLKAMEAIIRAKQLGGEEAQAIMLCKADNSTCTDLQSGLEDEMGDDNPHLRIWGRTRSNNLPNLTGLTNKFTDYLKDISW